MCRVSANLKTLNEYETQNPLSKKSSSIIFYLWLYVYKKQDCHTSLRWVNVSPALGSWSVCWDCCVKRSVIVLNLFHSPLHCLEGCDRQILRQTWKSLEHCHHFLSLWQGPFVPTSPSSRGQPAPCGVHDSACTPAADLRRSNSANFYLFSAAPSDRLSILHFVEVTELRLTEANKSK